MNLAKLLEGPAVAFHRGQFFESRGGSVLTPAAEGFAIDTDRYGPLDQRSLENSIGLALTPIGVWNDDIIDVLWRWRNARIGSLVTPVYDVSAIDTGTDVVTLDGAAEPRAGCPIRWATFGTKPAAIDLAVTYFYGVSGKIYDTEAHAITDDGTGKINFADDGDDDQMIIEQEPLTIWTATNRKIVFHNAAVTQMPALTFSTRQSLIGAVGFECFRKNDAPWSEANSLFTVTKELLNVAAPDPADIPTQEYNLAWGAAPWGAFQTRGVVTLTPTMTLSDISSDQRGVCGKKIASIGATAQGSPAGFSELQMLDILKMQGGTAGRGVSQTRADLEIVGTGVFATVKNAAARQLPQTFSAGDPRAGELAWVSSRTPGEAAFYLGETAEA